MAINVKILTKRLKRKPYKEGEKEKTTKVNVTRYN